MKTNRTELSMNEMEMVNGGYNLLGGAIGLAAGGPPGAVIGAVVGTLAEGTLVGYMAAAMDERKTNN